MIIAIGLIASIFVVMLSFTIQRKNIVVISSLLAVTTIVQYAMLDKYATMILSIITLLYGLTVVFEKRFPILKSQWSLLVLALVYSSAFLFLNVFSWSIELMAFVASLSGVVIMAMKNQIAVKWLMLINGVTWMVYQLSVGAFGQLPGEIFYTIGVIFSLTVLYRAKSSGMNLNKVPEFSSIIKNKFVDMMDQKTVLESSAV